MMESITIAVVVLFILLVTRDIIDLAPTLAMCLLRGKENRNLYNNSRMRRSCNRIYMGTLPSAMIILSFYNMYNPIETEPGFQRLAVTLAAFACYSLLRYLLRLLFYKSKVKNNDFKCVLMVSRIFAVIGILLIFTVFGICKLIGVEDSLVRDILKWTIISVYCFCLLRSFQVFSSQRGFLPAFLYLCSLEILPTGILVASYYVL